jgi:hypothetical protein
LEPSTKGNEAVFTHFGKMGINTDDPKEALSVHGSILERKERRGRRRGERGTGSIFE